MRNVKVETPISETEVRKKPSPVVDGIPCFRMLRLGRDSVVREAVVECYTINMYILIKAQARCAQSTEMSCIDVKVLNLASLES